MSCECVRSMTNRSDILPKEQKDRSVIVSSHIIESFTVILYSKVYYQI